MEQVIKITGRQFREKQKNYLELADKGARIILQRGRKRAYVLTPVDDEEMHHSHAVQGKFKVLLNEKYTLNDEQLAQKMCGRDLVTDTPSDTKEDYDNLINKSSGRLIDGMEKWL